MGFETGDELFAFYEHIIWSIPMGFETTNGYNKKKSCKKFEVSLWDLKRIKNGVVFFVDRFEVSLWDLKLYTKQECLPKRRDLKYPYGIWNRWCRYVT